MRLMSKNHFQTDKSSLVRAVRDIYFIPEGTPLNVQLLKFQRRKERIGLWSMSTAIFRGWSRWKTFSKIVGDFTTHGTEQTVTVQPDGS